jgi:hypothetical protein
MGVAEAPVKGGPAGDTMKGARSFSMSADPSQHFERDYIRLAERFKALSTFSQFLQGIHRAFLSGAAEPVPDLGSLYEQIKVLAERIRDDSPDRVATRIREIEAKLEAAAAQLRNSDMALSPSLTRRFFEKVRPADERIPFYLLLFYLTRTDTDEDLLDKVDYLVTAAAAGGGEPGAPAARSREEIRALFEKLLDGTEAAPIDAEVAAQIAGAFDELASQIAGTKDFAGLAAEGRIESLRTLKRQLARGQAQPEILTAVASCNLTARAVFQRLYEKERHSLRESLARIEKLERRAGKLDVGSAAVLRRFRDSGRTVEGQEAEGTLRWRQLLELHEAAEAAVHVLDGWIPDSRVPGEEGSPETEPLLLEEDDLFWKPCLRRIHQAVDATRVEGAGPDCHLERWEAEAAVRSSSSLLSKSESAVLYAAALRVKAEIETEAARGREGPVVPPDLLEHARETLSHVTELDHVFAELVGAQVFSGSKDEDEDVRQWMRTRLRLIQAAAALWLELDVATRGA